MMTPSSVKVFRYIDDLDCFVVSEEYKEIADMLGLSEWHPAVWIGRLFLLDNDYGEHWFDNWDLREDLESEAEKLGIPYDELMVVNPDRFQNGKDGPCHTPEIRKQFWTDVLKSLELSYELLFAEARLMNAKMGEHLPDMYITDLEERIERHRERINSREQNELGGK